MTNRMFLVFLLISGCAHYSLEEANIPLSVNTIITPPHLQVREADLTRLLVSELRARGYDAAWNATGENQVSCKITQDRLDELDIGVSAGLIAECQVRAPSGDFQVRSTGLGYAKAGPETFSTVTDLAAAQAIKDVSFRIDSGFRNGNE
jgi:hypothetical protein